MIRKCDSDFTTSIRLFGFVCEGLLWFEYWDSLDIGALNPSSLTGGIPIKRHSKNRKDRIRFVII
jgi:hypothetical protein